ncbi:hypothetical protein AB6A40_007255 [Gnathostoma spinigerum]|uniref:Copper transport protein n=1 Tax=Gnathostoma spinigerum TaxID=75299 RepID=A0ABD6ESV9_9BILA
MLTHFVLLLSEGIHGNGARPLDNHTMELHFGNREIILFRFWKSGSALGMLASVIIVILLCVLFEGIKAFRLFLRNMYSENCLLPCSAGNKLWCSGRFSNQTIYRIGQTLLYTAQIALAYTIILILVTFNVYLLIAVVLGEAVGYFIFFNENFPTSGATSSHSYLQSCSSF